MPSPEPPPLRQRPTPADAVDKGVIKVVYSGSVQDVMPVAKHVRREGQNKTIQKRLRDAEDELQYKNVKADYVTALWTIINWADVATRYTTAKPA